MAQTKRQTLAQLQKQCDDWNAAHEVGAEVSFEEIQGDGETHRGASCSEAQVLSGHSAVIWLEGKRGCVHLAHCTAVESEVEA
jgi:hypothetical protein